LKEIYFSLKEKRFTNICNADPMKALIFPEEADRKESWGQKP
jgi:hypothetical protein